MAIKSNRLKRLIVAIVLVLTSLVIGVVGGVKIASINKVTSTDDKSHIQQLADILSENWYSEIFYGKEADEDLLIHQFIGALSTGESRMLDPYTFLIKNEEGQTGIVAGKIGITMNYFYNYPIITEVHKDGPAYNRILPGDIIVQTGKVVEGVMKTFSIVDDNVDFSTIVNYALGTPNEKMFIKVARFIDNKLTYETFDITLAANLTNPYSSLVETDLNDTLMVKLTSFVDSAKGSDTCSELESILKKNTKKNIIIDLRDNGGGSLASVVNICDLFLPNDYLVTSLYYKDGTVNNYYTDDDVCYEFDNIIFFQNEKTASASEIMISTLQYYLNDKVTLIGGKTYGKGIAQLTTKVFGGAYSLQYTCARWLRPDNSWIGMTGSMFTENYQLGFDPSENCLINKSELLTLMESSNSYIFYKENPSFAAFKYDNVHSINKYFFMVYNKMFNKNFRTDYYFDLSSKQAIMNYQILKNTSTKDGVMNEETFLYFVRDFYNQKEVYLNTFINKAKLIVGD